MAEPVVNTDFWILLLAQLPIVASLLIALQRGWIYMGRTVDRELADWRERWEREAKERKEAEVRLDSFRETIKANLDVLERSVELTERVLNRGPGSSIRD